MDGDTEKDVKLPHVTGHRDTLQEMFQRDKPKLENIEALKKTVIKGTSPENNSYAKEREQRDAEIINAQGKELDEQKQKTLDLETQIHDLIEQNSHNGNIIQRQASELLKQDIEINIIKKSEKKKDELIEKLIRQAQEKDQIIAKLQSGENQKAKNQTPEKKQITEVQFYNGLHDFLDKYSKETEGINKNDKENQEKLVAPRKRMLTQLNDLFNESNRENDWNEIKKGNFDLLQNDKSFKKEDISEIVAAVITGTEDLDQLINIANGLSKIGFHDSGSSDPKLIAQNLGVLKILIENSMSGKSPNEKVTANGPTVGESKTIMTPTDALNHITRLYGFKFAANRIIGDFQSYAREVSIPTLKK